MNNQYRKKPVVIEAVQLSEEIAASFLFDGVPLPAGVEFDSASTKPEERKINNAYFYIQTLEGRMEAKIGDWIITGVKGERYPCKPDIFAATYESAALLQQSREGAGPFGYVTHSKGCAPSTSDSLVDVEEAEEYVPECVTPVYLHAAPDSAAEIARLTGELAKANERIAELIYLVRIADGLLPIFNSSEVIGNWRDQLRKFNAGEGLDIFDADMLLQENKQLRQQLATARADERERCAAICDGLQQQWRPAGECADAIRALGDEGKTT